MSRYATRRLARVLAMLALAGMGALALLLAMYGREATGLQISRLLARCTPAFLLARLARNTTGWFPDAGRASRERLLELAREQPETLARVLPEDQPLDDAGCHSIDLELANLLSHAGQPAARAFVERCARDGCLEVSETARGFLMHLDRHPRSNCRSDLVGLASHSDAPRLVPLWTREVRGAGVHVRAARDLDGDGAAEVVVASEDAVHVLRGRDGHWLWSRDGWDLVSTPALIVAGAVRPRRGDNSRVRTSIVVLESLGWEPDHLVALDGQTGQTVWKTPVLAPMRATAGDLDGDGLPEIVLLNWGPDQGPVQLVTALDGRTGRRLWSRPLATSVLDALSEPPQVADLDGDGRPEVAVLSEYTLDHREDSIWVLDGATGTLEARIRVEGRPLLIRDSDRTGRPALLAWTPRAQDDDRPPRPVGRLAAYALATGSPRLRWSFEILPRGVPCDSSPVAMQLSSEGPTSLDELVTAVGCTLTCIRGGQRVWAVPVPGPVHGLSRGDLDGDRTPEVVVTTTYWFHPTSQAIDLCRASVYLLDGRSGRLLSRYALDALRWQGPAIGDLDGVGTDEVVVAAGEDTYRRIVALRLERTANPK